MVGTVLVDRGNITMKGVFFGVEYDNDDVPNAIVVAGSRSGKFVKWVKEYAPVWVNREDGKKVLRERRCLQLPFGFRLRKDEIKGEMKAHKTANWQDGKFYVLHIHTTGNFIHPAKAAMEKEKKDADQATEGEGDKGPIVAGTPNAANT